MLTLSVLVPCWGQGSTKEVDSLSQLIERHSKEDEEKVRLLNDYARQCFRNYEFKRGLIATRKGRILSEKLGFDGGKIMYYLSLSVYFGDGAMNNYYQKQAQWLSNDPAQPLSKYYVDLPKIDYNPALDYSEFIDEYTPLLDHFEKLNDKEIQACILYTIASYQYDLGMLEESIPLMDRIMDLYATLEQTFPVFLLKTFKMNNLAQLGRDEESEKLQAEIITMVTKQQDSNSIGLINISMGTSYAQSGRNALAIEYYTRSIPIFERA